MAAPRVEGNALMRAPLGSPWHAQQDHGGDIVFCPSAVRTWFVGMLPLASIVSSAAPGGSAEQLNEQAQGCWGIRINLFACSEGHVASGVAYFLLHRPELCHNLSFAM